MKNILIIVLSIIVVLVNLTLGIYVKFIFSSLILLITIFLVKKEKKLIILSLVSIIIMPNIFRKFNIENLNYDKNGIIIKEKLQKTNDNYYAVICPFISNICYSVKKYSNVGFGKSLNNEEKEQSNYIDMWGNIYFQENSNKREKYLDNKAIQQTSFLYKTFFIPTSKEDLIIYNYAMGKNINPEEFSNNCTLLLYGAQNGWSNYKNELIKQMESKKESCFQNLEGIVQDNYGETKNKQKLLNFLKSNN